MKVFRNVALPACFLLVSLITACGGFHGVVTPTISSITPSTIAAGSAAFTLTVNGTNFISGTQILWDGAAQPTTVVSSTQLTAQIPAALVASAGVVTIRVMKPDTTTSSTTTLMITGSGGTSSFSLTSLNPYTVAMGSASFTLTATGVGFASGDSITWNGAALATTFDSSTQLHATVPAVNVVTAATIQVAVQDANKNTTNILPFIVTGGSAGTPPTLTSLNPNTSFNNIPSLSLATNGTGFVSGSVIVWNGTAMPTTFVSSTQLTTTIPGNFLTLVGTENVFVLNPDSTVSNTLPFNITVNPSTTPTLTSISPTKTAVGSPSFTLTLNGTNFAPGCVAYFGGNPLPTTVVSDIQLTAQVPASDLTAVAEIPVTAQNTQSKPSNPIPFLVGMNIFFGEVNDLVWDAARNTLYISQPGGSTKNPDTVVAIDPISLAILWTYSPGSGSEPDRLALSPDGKYLYVGLDGNGTVERLDLGNQTAVPEISIPLGSDSNLGPYYAMDIEVDPVQTSTIAVARGIPPSVSIVQAVGGVAIYDNATQRPNIISPTTQAGNVLLDTIQWSLDGTQIYAANNENYDGDFYQLGVSASGVSLVSDKPGLFPIPNLRIHLDPTTKLLYGDDGLVVDPGTAASEGNFVSSGVMTTDAALNNAYFVGQSAADVQTVAYEVESFNLTNFNPVAQLHLYQVEGVPQHVVRWGANGLAFATKKVTNCVISPCTIQDGRLYVIYGPFVTQQ
jgi:trimeric autotransporter adhesin